jgi:hypothetical protein
VLRFSLPRWTVTVVLCLATFGITAAVTAGASSSPKTFYACLRGGTLSKVSTSTHTCASGYKLVSWNAVGPQGLQGPKGDTGPQGPGSQSTYAPFDCTSGCQSSPSLALAAGDWVISDSTVNAVGGCGFLTSPNVTILADGLGDTTSSVGNASSPLALVSVGLGGGTLNLGCSGNKGAGPAGALIAAMPTTFQPAVSSATGAKRPLTQFATEAQVQRAQATANEALTTARRALALDSHPATISYLGDGCQPPASKVGSVVIVQTPVGQNQYNLLIPICKLRVAR